VMFDELERFVSAHRGCGALSADVDELTETGYGLQVACSCGAVFERWITLERAECDLLYSRLQVFSELTAWAH
jgi:hypothetical protein